MPTLDFPCASHVLINKEKNSNESMMIPRVEEEMELHREGQPSELLEISQSLNNFRFNYHTLPSYSQTSQPKASIADAQTLIQESKESQVVHGPPFGFQNLLLWYQFVAFLNIF